MRPYPTLRKGGVVFICYRTSSVSDWSCGDSSRPQPGNALQEGRDASEKREGLGNRPWEQISVLLLLFSSLLLLRVLARGPAPGKQTLGAN